MKKILLLLVTLSITGCYEFRTTVQSKNCTPEGGIEGVDSATEKYYVVEKIKTMTKKVESVEVERIEGCSLISCSTGYIKIDSLNNQYKNYYSSVSSYKKPLRHSFSTSTFPDSLCVKEEKKCKNNETVKYKQPNFEKFFISTDIRWHYHLPAPSYQEVAEYEKCADEIFPPDEKQPLVCEQGYSKDTSQEPETCVSTVVNCELDELAVGVASAKKIWNSQANYYSQCKPDSCSDGFNLENEACNPVVDVCAENQQANPSCPDYDQCMTNPREQGCPGYNPCENDPQAHPSCPGYDICVDNPAGPGCPFDPTNCQAFPDTCFDY